MNDHQQDSESAQPLLTERAHGRSGTGAASALEAWIDDLRTAEQGRQKPGSEGKLANCSTKEQGRERPAP
jgi:hypothetical protein